jgi:protein-S-isoprenylcysteine O-methyltransferase Ste14
MNFFTDIHFGIYNLWWFTVFYFIINTAIVLMFPRHNLSRFLNVPKILYISNANHVLYFIFFILTIFVPVKLNSIVFIVGFTLFVLGILLFFVSMFYFAVSEYNKPVTEKIYKLSRHPIYLSFLIISTGISVSGASILLLSVALLHFFTSYFIARAEEKECEKLYGNEYINYKKKVRMFI